MGAHFSRRLGALEHGLNPLAAAVAERRAKNAPVLDLTLSNPTAAGFDYPAERICDALSGSESLEYHPDPRGHAAARDAISDYYANRGETRAAADLLLTTSTSEAYSFLLKLLCDPGDAVCVPAPSYPLLEYLADLESVRLASYPLTLGETQRRTRWRIDFAALERALTDRTRAIIVINPNNPTGNLLTREEVTECLALASRRQVALIVDEVFSDYCLADISYAPAVSTDGLVFTLNGFSKILALPQLKLGWIHVGGAPALRRAALERLEIIADTFLSVNTPVQAACPALLSLRKGLQSQIQRRLQVNLAALSKLVSARNEMTLLPVEGGWNAVIRMHTVEPEESLSLRLLRDADVFAHPGAFFGFTEGCHMVVSLLTPEREFEAGIRGIAEFAARRML